MAYAELILFMAILLKHFLDLVFPSLQCKIGSSQIIIFPPIFLEFCSAFSLLFSENFAGNIGAALVDRTFWTNLSVMYYAHPEQYTKY